MDSGYTQIYLDGIRALTVNSGLGRVSKIRRMGVVLDSMFGLMRN